MFGMNVLLARSVDVLFVYQFYRSVILVALKYIFGHLAIHYCPADTL